MLFLAAISGEALQFAMGVHIYVQNRLYMSAVKLPQYFEAFKTRYGLA